MAIRNLFTLLTIFCWFAAPSIYANPNPSQMKADRSSIQELKYRYEMSLDISAMYIRDTRPLVGSDTAVKASLGGMFASWVGLDVGGLFKIKSQSYLAAGSLKLVPIDWLFFKAGYGAYSDKQSRTLTGTPVLGGGLTGRFSEYYYMVAEALYFKVPDQGKNLGFGIGLGLIF